jgi:NTP pyrophosphatase (non-canonical NTP hydrolase)
MTVEREFKELIPAGVKLSIEDFKVLAMRTESIVDKVFANKEEFVALLQAYIACGEMLDCLKKKIYYKKDVKYVENFDRLLNELSEKVEAIRKAKGKPEEKLDEVSPRVTHGVLGITTESSELAQAYLKGLDNKGMDAINTQEEMADGAGGCGTSWYSVILEDELGIDPYEGMRRVINKLAYRYPNGFSIEHADQRDLVLERLLLEGKIVDISK